jgi:hypothetical protein
MHPICKESQTLLAVVLSRAGLWNLAALRCSFMCVSQIPSCKNKYHFDHRTGLSGTHALWGVGALETCYVHIIIFEPLFSCEQQERKSVQLQQSARLQRAWCHTSKLHAHLLMCINVFVVCMRIDIEISLPDKETDAAFVSK